MYHCSTGQALTMQVRSFLCLPQCDSFITQHFSFSFCLPTVFCFVLVSQPVLFEKVPLEGHHYPSDFSFGAILRQNILPASVSIFRPLCSSVSPVHLSMCSWVSVTPLTQWLQLMSSLNADNLCFYS